MIGTTELGLSLLLLVVPGVITLFVLYWVIRLAVRHGVRDAQHSTGVTRTGSTPPPAPSH